MDENLIRDSVGGVFVNDFVGGGFVDNVHSGAGDVHFAGVGLEGS